MLCILHIWQIKLTWLDLNQNLNRWLYTWTTSCWIGYKPWVDDSIHSPLNVESGVDPKYTAQKNKGNTKQCISKSITLLGYHSVRKQHWFWIKGLNARNTSALVLECFYKSGSGVSLNSETHRKVWPKGYCVHINGPHLFSAFMQSALQCWLTFTHSCTHSHTKDGVNDAGRQPAGQELSGWGVSLSYTMTPCGYQPTRYQLPPELLPTAYSLLNMLLCKWNRQQVEMRGN